jgi:hypothetical protein
MFVYLVDDGVLLTTGLVEASLAGALGGVGLHLTSSLCSNVRNGQQCKKNSRKNSLSAPVVRLSLALSIVDLEESGVIFSSARSEKDLRKVSDMLKMFV